MPKILPQIIRTISFTGSEQARINSCLKAAETLYNEWGKIDNNKWEEWVEIILLLDQSKPDMVKFK